MAVQSEKEYMQKAAKVLGLPEGVVGRETRVPWNKVHEIFNILAFPGCSDDTSMLPQDREPTLWEVAGSVKCRSGD